MIAERKSWSLDRSISVGDLLVFLTLLGAGLAYVMSQDQRQTKAEERIVTLQNTDVRHDDEIKSFKADIGSKLDKLNDKMDRVIERGR